MLVTLTPPSSGNSPEPGWYLDPEDERFERWWDGANWGDHKREAPADEGSNGFSLTDLYNYGEPGKVSLTSSRKGVGVRYNLGPVGTMVFSVVWLLFALGFTSLLVMSSFSGIQDPVKSTATITSVDEKVNRKDSGVSCNLAYDLKLEDGSVRSARTPLSSVTFCSRAVGDIVEVTYDRADPSKIEGFDSGISIAVFLMLGVFILAGIFLNIVSFKGLRRHLQEKRASSSESSKYRLL